jgi:hypothetical protein
VGAIVGGVIGGVVAVFAAISIATFVPGRQGRGGPRPISTLAEQQSLVTEERAELIDLHRIPSTQSTTLPPPQSLVGTPVPVGLSSTELARLSTEGLNSQQSRNLGVSSSNVLESTSLLDAVPESHEAPYDPSPRRLHSDVESLVRGEMERFHAEGLVFGAPPIYREGDE